jgi:hypothetical protein
MSSAWILPGRSQRIWKSSDQRLHDQTTYKSLLCFTLLPSPLLLLLLLSFSLSLFHLPSSLSPLVLLLLLSFSLSLFHLPSSLSPLLLLLLLSFSLSLFHLPSSPFSPPPPPLTFFLSLPLPSFLSYYSYGELVLYRGK